MGPEDRLTAMKAIGLVGEIPGHNVPAARPKPTDVQFSKVRAFVCTGELAIQHTGLDRQLARLAMDLRACPPFLCGLGLSLPGRVSRLILDGR